MRLSWGIGWYLRLLLVAGIAAGVLIAGAFAWYAASPHTPPSLPLQFNLKAGTTLRGAAHEMGRAGALRRPEAFVLMGRLLRTASRIKAGNYEITEPVTPAAKDRGRRRDAILHPVRRGLDLPADARGVEQAPGSGACDP
jgi:UPF0755 protein